MKILNCAIIGFGNIGKHHADFIVKNKNSNLVYIFEKDKKIINRYKNKYKNVKWIGDENIIYKDKSIKLLILCSYDNFHYSQIIKAIKNHKNIFCEKPICQNIKQLRKIYSLLKSNNSIKFTSNLILRTVYEFKLLNNLIKSNSMGKIYYSEADYNYGRLNKITNGWRATIPFYSIISGGGVHLIDIICNFLDEYPKSVYASSNKIVTANSNFKYSDFVVSILKFASQNISKITANFGCISSHHHQLKFFGTKGTFFKDYNSSKLILNRDDEKKKIKEIPSNKKYNKSEILKYFIKNLEKKKIDKKVPDQTDLIKVMLVCFAIEKSFKTNKEVLINYKKLSLS